MGPGQVPLYVRLSEEPSRRLERAVTVSGKSKRQIVEDAVSGHLDDDGLVVARALLRQEPADVMTLEEAAALLRIARADLKSAAKTGTVPGRRIGGSWRFSRAALLAWLDHKAQ